MLSIYKASAGSGKTFTLAYEYIKMLLGVKNPTTGRYRLNRDGREQHRHILAVTFTNKATDEMKRRIIHELAVLGGLETNWDSESPYKTRLCREFDCKPDELREASAAALRQLLFDFNFFQVSTIDSFFQTILRTFAQEVDISGNYDVDLDNDRAIGYGVRELFDSLVIDSESTQTRRLLQWITQYLLDELSMGRQISLFNRSSNVHARFLRFIKSISNDIFSSNYSRIMEYLSKPERLQRLSERLTTLEQSELAETKQLCREAIRLIADRGYDTDKSFKINVYLQKQLADIALSGEEKSTRQTAAKVNNDINAAFNKKLATRLEENPDTDLTDAIKRTCEAIVTSGARLRLIRQTRSNIFVLGLLERVYHHINDYRNDNNTIFLSDTNSLLRDIIGDDDTPFVYERAGIWINHFLIDEFQDTSRLQWENLRPLLHEGQATDNDSLIIGDEKQCIYRFRFSDPTLLQHEVQAEFKGKVSLQGNNDSGNTNWRSSTEVVNFNNSLFSHMADSLKFNEIYANICQRVSPAHTNHHGYVKTAAIDTADSALLHSTALKIMTDDIVRQLHAGYNPCDIAVLTRFNSEAADVIAHLMESATERPELSDIRIISDDAMSVASAPAVRLIISVMRFLAMPDDDTTDKTAYDTRRARLREIGRMINRFEHLLSQTGDVDESLRRAIAASEKAGPESDKTSNDEEPDDAAAGSMACFNVPSLVQRIIVRYIPPEVAESQNMYIAAFVDVITDYCSRGTTDLRSFLQWWDDAGHRAKISAPFDRKAIRVMSIHKSKGLEFKCVHIPFIDWKMVEFRDIEWFATDKALQAVGNDDIVPPLLPLKPAAWMEQTPLADQYLARCREQLLDELNVLYVAMTRAVDELSICYRNSSGKPESYLISDYIDTALNMMELKDIVPENTRVMATGVAGDDNTVVVRMRGIGDPTIPSGDKARQRTALEPDDTDDMPPYTTADREDLWMKLDIEHNLDYSVARERGILLHDVLARVHDSGDIEKAVHYCSYRGRLPKGQSADVAGFLKRELEREDIAPWFNEFNRVACERPMVLPSGDICRPDRIVWTADGHVDVIDYKFGDEHTEKYGKQVKGYMTALRDMGYPRVRGFIWYVDSGVIRTVN